MRTGDAFWRLIGALLLTVSISACSQLAIAATPQIDFQDVRLSLSTVNPADYLHHFEYDRDQPLDIREIRSWRRLNVTVTELTFASPRGEAVPTLLFEPMTYHALKRIWSATLVPGTGTTMAKCSVISGL